MGKFSLAERVAGCRFINGDGGAYACTALLFNCDGEVDLDFELLIKGEDAV